MAWRLPTIHDYEQAEIDGIRFVMPDMGMGSSGIYEWSATVYSSLRSEAWLFSGSLGLVNAANRNSTPYGARCVGR